MDGPRVLVYSTVFGGTMGTFEPEDRRGIVSVLDRATGAWKVFDPAKDFTTNVVTGMYAANGEILLTTTEGVYRWRHPAWELINTGAALKNPAISAVAGVGDEVWVGFSQQRFGEHGVPGDQPLQRKDRPVVLDVAGANSARQGRWATSRASRAKAWVLFPTNEYLGLRPAQWTWLPI